MTAPTQTVREAFALHRSRLMSRAEVERKLRPALAGLRDPKRKHAAYHELVQLRPYAPLHPDLLRGLLTKKKAPYDEDARRLWFALADAIGDRGDWNPPATGAWDEYDQQVLVRLAEGRHEKGTDSELHFEGLGPTIGRYHTELRWPAEHDAAVKDAYLRFLGRGYDAGVSDYDRDRARSPWSLEEIAGYFRRSALLQLFEELAPLVEDVRCFAVTQMIRYEIWIVDGVCYVKDWPDDIDHCVGDVIVPLLRSHPGDELLRAFVAGHRRGEARRELEAIEHYRQGASVEEARAWIDGARELGADVAALSAKLDELIRR
jgi:hypothetical protein